LNSTVVHQNDLVGFRNCAGNDLGEDGRHRRVYSAKLRNEYGAPISKSLSCPTGVIQLNKFIEACAISGVHAADRYAPHPKRNR
jgi:hypothetical protein